MSNFLSGYGQRTTTTIPTADDISRLITKRKWTKLLKLFHTTTTNNERPFPQNHCLKCNTKHRTFLHLACQYEPPLSILQKFVTIDSNLISERDCRTDQLPLHIAIRYGADVDVIEYLLQMFPEGAKSQDIQGKTPLHSLFQYYHDTIENVYLEHFVRDYTYQVTKRICDIAPEAVLLEDTDGKSALECAIEEEVSYKVVKILQKTAVKFITNRGCRRFSLTRNMKHKQKNAKAA